MEQVRERDDVARDAGRVVSLRRRDDLIGIGRNVAQQLDFLGLIEKRQLLVRAGAQRQALARELLEEAADPCVGVLHVIDRVLGLSLIHISF